MSEWIDKLQKEITALRDSIHIEKILKGFSTDEKYRVYLSNGENRLLRIFKLDQWAQKKAEYDIIKTIQTLGVKASSPIELGMIPGRDIGYMVLSYLDGEDARDVLPELSVEEQQQIGYLAGCDLASMHQLSAPTSVSSWYERCIQKHRNYVRAYQESSLEITHADKINVFIEDHLTYLKNRPNRFLHDDFHVGNLIVHERQYAGVIDFNRYDWGDPIHEFTKLAFFSREISVPFCNGQIMGYFHNEEPPDSFWILYSVYTAMTIFSSVVWTGRVVPSLLDDMNQRVNKVIEEHQAFECTIPVWFSRTETHK
ncbi:aminoglycoside phosphotransferase family protein [uncultured Brevibacillus sp.]|uniref:aminoglycoside phosphotransferase family protein n=1 Tax=uncultured Brevibacillus sp. TaxID=169970 RepID=UPI002598406A|nr:phosphotransferase [uncultured Brevibacillus sp.]